MSDKKSTPSAPAAKSPEAKRKAALRKVSALQNGRMARIAKNAVKMIAAFALIFFTDKLLGSWLLDGSVTGAILYQFAFDGKVSGRMDSNVLMRNGRGRAFVVPALVQNAYTTFARAIFSSFSSVYSTLTNSQILSWRNMTWYFQSNRFGVSKMVNGKQAFISLNTNLTLIGETPIVDAPLSAGELSSVTDFIIVPDQSASTMVLTSASLPTSGDSTFIVKATRPLPFGVTRPGKSDFRLLDVIIDDTQTSPISLDTAYSDKFGSAWIEPGYLGARIYFEFTAINQNRGNAGATIIVPAIIQA